jgi:transglutaminase-like putative cysteine protease
MNSSQIGSLWTIDRLSSIQPSTSTGAYRVTVAQSTASIDDLRAAGTTYPAWLQSYKEPARANYRDPRVLARISELAQKIVADANAVTPYDQASAIEAYLRSGKFTYTLQPPAAPEGRDPLEYFLFTSYRGYCEFFATAMGDMLRSLKIPTRLVNGYGPGTFDSAVGAFVVRGEDAHTWVEVYFPDYGWIPFEPTKDNEDNYPVIPRGSSGPNTCLRDNACENPTTTGAGGAPNSGPAAGPKNPRGELDPGSLAGGFRVRVPDAGTLTTVVGVLLALLLLLLVAATRYLRPRTVMGVWNRMLDLAHLAGAERRPGETPRELSQRLQKTFPEASEHVGSLASGFAVAAYAPPDEAATARSSVMESWSVLRPMLIRRVLSRLKPRSLF